MPTPLRKLTTFLLTLTLVTSLMATLPPLELFLKSQPEQAVEQSFGDAADLPLLESTRVCLLPEPQPEKTLVLHKRSLEASLPLRENSALVVAQKARVEATDYCQSNDLHFNTPALVPRQSSSDHATEG